MNNIYSEHEYIHSRKLVWFQYLLCERKNNMEEFGILLNKETGKKYFFPVSLFF